MMFGAFHIKSIDILYDRSENERVLREFILKQSAAKRMRIEEISDMMPTLFEWLNKNELIVRSIFFIFAMGNSQQIIHSNDDTDIADIALNISLNHSDDIIIHSYDKLGIPESENRKKYEFYEVKEKIKMANTSPILLNIKKPHSIHNESTYNSGILSFRFIKDTNNILKGLI